MSAESISAPPPAPSARRIVRVEYLDFRNVPDHREYRFAVYGPDGSDEIRFRIADRRVRCRAGATPGWPRRLLSEAAAGGRRRRDVEPRRGHDRRRRARRLPRGPHPRAEASVVDACRCPRSHRSCRRTPPRPASPPLPVAPLVHERCRVGTRRRPARQPRGLRGRRHHLVGRRSHRHLLRRGRAEDVRHLDARAGGAVRAPHVGDRPPRKEPGQRDGSRGGLRRTGRLERARSDPPYAIEAESGTGSASAFARRPHRASHRGRRTLARGGLENDGLHARRRSLRNHDLSPMRPQRASAAADLAGPLAQLRRRGRVRERARHRAPGLRPGRDAPGPRQQLRPPARFRRGDDGPHPRPRPPPAPRRARDLQQGRLPHVAGALRRVGLAEVPPLEPGPEPATPAPRLRGHLLFPPPRSRDAPRGDDDGARPGGSPGQGPLRRALELRLRI